MHSATTKVELKWRIEVHWKIIVYTIWTKKHNNMLLLLHFFQSRRSMSKNVFYTDASTVWYWQKFVFDICRRDFLGAVAVKNRILKHFQRFRFETWGTYLQAIIKNKIRNNCVISHFLVFCLFSFVFIIGEWSFSKTKKDSKKKLTICLVYS